MLLLSKRHLIDIKKGVQMYQSNQSIDNKLYNDKILLGPNTKLKFSCTLASALDN